jgi:transposase
MRRFVEGTDRGQATLFPECLADWIDENNPVQVIDAFVDKLDLSRLGFDGVAPEATGRPSYHPSVLLKLYIYGYLNRVQSSRRLEREAGRNVEVMWLTGRLTPDHKTIADFRKDSGPAIKQVCVQFIELCRLMGLLTKTSVAIDGSKFKAVNTRDRNFTRGKVERRRAQLEKSVARYLAQLDTADLHEPSEELAAKTAEGEAGEAGKRDGAIGGDGEIDAGIARSADLSDRSRRPLDGDQRPRLRRGRLQCAGRRRYATSPDRHA